MSVDQKYFKIVQIQNYYKQQRCFQVSILNSLPGNAIPLTVCNSVQACMSSAGPSPRFQESKRKIFLPPSQFRPFKRVDKSRKTKFSRIFIAICKINPAPRKRRTWRETEKLLSTKIDVYIISNTASVRSSV